MKADSVPLDDLRSKSGGVFRSEDGGETWTRMSAIDPRPFYFSQIRIDPANDQRVYLLGFALLVSDDGGKNFREDFRENSSRLITRWRFNPALRHRRSRQSRKIKTSSPRRIRPLADRQNLKFVSVYCSELTAAFIKVLPAEKIGTT